MVKERLEFALQELEPEDWRLFERFAAEFMSVQYPSLRTMAAPAGDRGRDGQLFIPGEALKTAFQYSVAANWKDKLAQTVVKLKTEFPGVTRLIYCTNQRIGPAADELVETVRLRDHVALDICDRNWFLERAASYPQRAEAAEALAERIVDPILTSRGLADRSALPIAEDDARIALLHLALEQYDENSDRNLTKSSYEALVLAALHDTRQESAISQDQVVELVDRLVPVGNREQVRAQTLGALNRLSVKNGPVKFNRRTANYHISHQATVDRSEREAAYLLGQTRLEEELAAGLSDLDLALSIERVSEIAVALRTAIEQVLFDRGEAFARSTRESVMIHVDIPEILNTLTAAGENLAPLSSEAAADVVFRVLDDPSPGSRSHLARLADAYTLFAFLQQTPDVQKAVVNVFSGGEIWLDTSMALPLIAETLVDDPKARYFTPLLRAARDAGCKLYVTPGILEEIESHMRNTLACARVTPADWHARVPFLYSVYVLSGRGSASVYDWLTEFRGSETPTDDLAEYLESEFGIHLHPLDGEFEAAPADLRAAVKEVWLEAHERRRRPEDPALSVADTAFRLAAHDTEACVGIMQLRKSGDRSDRGFKHWWLTLDQVAFRLREVLGSRISDPPPSPAMSPDFLSQFLRLGPLRRALESEDRVGLPLVLSLSKYEAIPRELLAVADETRRRFADQSERVIRRRVKEDLNRARWRLGPQAIGGIRAAEARVKDQLAAQASGGRLDV